MSDSPENPDAGHHFIVGRGQADEIQRSHHKQYKTRQQATNAVKRLDASHGSAVHRYHRIKTLE